MPDQLAAEPALEVDAVECSPVGRGKVLVRVQGRWRGGRRRALDSRTMLVVEDEGRRHRFPAVPQPRRPRIGRGGSGWSASFSIPAWLAPHLEGQMTLSIGDSRVPVPPIAFTSAEVSMSARDDGSDLQRAGDSGRLETGNLDASTERVAEVEGAGSAADSPTGAGGHDAPSEGVESAADPPLEAASVSGAGGTETPPDAADDFSAIDRGGPEAISALRAELRERAGALARIHGVLADLQAQLEARTANQTRLESIQAELGTELGRLRELVEQEATQRSDVESRALTLAAQVDEQQQQLQDLRSGQAGIVHQRDSLVHEVSSLRSQLATSEVGREAARTEAEGLRAELDRLGSELAAAREQVGGRQGGLAEAEALLSEARALTARLREH